MTLNGSKTERFARNFWWLGALLMPLLFNLLLIGAARLAPSVFYQFSIDGTRRDLGEGFKLALFTGNVGFLTVTFLSSLLAYFTLNKPCHARRFKIWLLALVGILFWGALLITLARFQPNPDADPTLAPAFPIDIIHVLFCGLPLLWSLALIYIALTHSGASDAADFDAPSPL